MGFCCAVAECRNTAKIKNKRKDLLYHRFPVKNPLLCKLWMSKCNRRDRFAPENRRICSDHFQPSDYEDDMRNRLLGLPQKRNLKHDAIPTIFTGRRLAKKSESKSSNERQTRFAVRSRRAEVQKILDQNQGECSPKKTKVNLNLMPQNLEVDELNSITLSTILTYNSTPESDDIAMTRVEFEVKLENDSEKDEVEEQIMDIPTNSEIVVATGFVDRLALWSS